MEQTAQVEQPVEVVEQPKDELEEGMKLMSKPALRKFLLDFFGYEAEDEVTKEVLLQTVRDLNNARIKAAQDETEKSARAEATKEDPIVEIRFQNIESKGTDLEFCYRAPTGKPAKPGIIPKYHLIDGETAKVPFSVYKHLGSLMVPRDEFVNGPDGFIRSVNRGKQHRFSCELLFTDDQLAKLGIGS